MEHDAYWDSTGNAAQGLGEIAELGHFHELVQMEEEGAVDKIGQNRCNLLKLEKVDKGDVHQDGNADMLEGHADQLGVVLVDDHVAT